MKTISGPERVLLVCFQNFCEGKDPRSKWSTGRSLCSVLQELASVTVWAGKRCVASPPLFLPPHFDAISTLAGLFLERVVV